MGNTEINITGLLHIYLCPLQSVGRNQFCVVGKCEMRTKRFLLLYTKFRYCHISKYCTCNINSQGRNRNIVSDLVATWRRRQVLRSTRVFNFAGRLVSSARWRPSVKRCSDSHPNDKIYNSHFNFFSLFPFFFGKYVIKAQK